MFSGANFIAKFFKQDTIKEKIYQFFFSTIDLQKESEYFSGNKIKIRISAIELNDSDPTNIGYSKNLDNLSKNIHYIVIQYKIFV